MNDENAYRDESMRQLLFLCLPSSTLNNKKEGVIEYQRLITAILISSATRC
jgi:hypothetical protein